MMLEQADKPLPDHARGSQDSYFQLLHDGEFRVLPNRAR
jgi:hypothetical protein